MGVISPSQNIFSWNRWIWILLNLAITFFLGPFRMSFSSCCTHFLLFFDRIILASSPIKPPASSTSPCFCCCCSCWPSPSFWPSCSASSSGLGGKCGDCTGGAEAGHPHHLHQHPNRKMKKAKMWKMGGRRGRRKGGKGRNYGGRDHLGEEAKGHRRKRRGDKCGQGKGRRNVRKNRWSFEFDIFLRLN